MTRLLQVIVCVCVCVCVYASVLHKDAWKCNDDLLIAGKPARVCVCCVCVRPTQGVHRRSKMLQVLCVMNIPSSL